MNDFKVKMTGRVFEWKIAPYHIRIKFKNEMQLHWEYIEAPEGEVGKNSLENLHRIDLRDDLLLLAWTEASGAEVIDVLDLQEMKVHPNFVMTDGQRFSLSSDMIELTR